VFKVTPPCNACRDFIRIKMRIKERDQQEDSRNKTNMARKRKKNIIYEWSMNQALMREQEKTTENEQKNHR